MAHHLTKHRPGEKDLQPPINSIHRCVEMPLGTAHGTSGAAKDYVSLGSREPSDGRYVSLVRSNYQHKTVKPFGESEVSPQSITQIVAGKQHRSQANRERQFYIGPGEDEIDLFMQRARSTTPSIGATPAASIPRSHSSQAQPAAHDVEESRKNALAMRACHMFISTTDQNAWKHGSASLMRTDIGKGIGGSHQSISPQERAQLRDSQRATHFSLGTSTAPVTSESRGQYRGAAADRTKSMKAESSSLQLGMSTVDVKDTLRSLKQVDFVPHSDAIGALREERRVAQYAAANKIVVTAETDSLVLGYDEEKANHVGKTTLYRSSYTPVSFIASPQRNR